MELKQWMKMTSRAVVVPFCPAGSGADVGTLTATMSAALLVDEEHLTRAYDIEYYDI